jgi:hypothetical protein
MIITTLLLPLGHVPFKLVFKWAPNGLSIIINHQCCASHQQHKDIHPHFTLRHLPTAIPSSTPSSPWIPLVNHQSKCHSSYSSFPRASCMDSAQDCTLEKEYHFWWVTFFHYYQVFIKHPQPTIHHLFNTLDRRWTRIYSPLTPCSLYLWEGTMPDPEH